MMGGGFNPDRTRIVTCARCEVAFETLSRVAKYCLACSMSRALRYDSARAKRPAKRKKAGRRG